MACDRNQDAKLDTAELAFVLEQLSGGQKPSSDEVQKLVRQLAVGLWLVPHATSPFLFCCQLELVDTNKDATCSFEEFATALSVWLKDEAKSQAKAETASKARSTIEARIASFFLQFKQSDDFASVRQRMTRKASSVPVPARSVSQQAADAEVTSSRVLLLAPTAHLPHPLSASSGCEAEGGARGAAAAAVARRAARLGGRQRRPALRRGAGCQRCLHSHAPCLTLAAAPCVQILADIMSIDDMFPLPRDRHRHKEVFLSVYVLV